MTHKYEFIYEDIDDRCKEKVAVTLETEVPMSEDQLNSRASFYNDMYDLNHVSWREIGR